MQGTYALASQTPLTTVRTINYGTYTTSTLPTTTTKEANLSPQNMSIMSDTLKTDFGRIKGIEILHFRAATLERNFGGQNQFASMGPLSVLYFPQYDRFVLSLNSWKYPLIKSIPIVGSSASCGVPVTYTLPTMGGFFTIIIPRVEHLEALYNLETILEQNSKFTVADSEEMSSHQTNFLGMHSNNILTSSQFNAQPSFVRGSGSLPYNGNIMQSNISPRYDTGYHGGQIGQHFSNTFQTGMLNQSQMGQTGMNQSLPIMEKRKKESWFKRIFRKSEYGRDPGNRVGSSRNNLNMIQKRDLQSMKTTNEVMAACTYYPRKEVERWIMYNKDMAQQLGYSCEHDESFDHVTGAPLCRSLGNLNNSQNLDPTLPCNQPITSERPYESITYQPGQNFTSAIRHDGKKNKHFIAGHSHSIHPDVSGRFNNLSRSDFQDDRFRNMSNAEPLYEASGISPINKMEQPYSFIQDDIVLEESKPHFAERAPVLTPVLNEQLPTFNEVQPVQQVSQPIVQQSNLSFAERVKEQIHHHEHRPEVLTGTGLIQTTSEIRRSPLRTVENVVPVQQYETVVERIQPTTQYITETRTVAPTLQERIRDVTIPTQEKATLSDRIKNVFRKTEDVDVHQDLAQAHYAA